MANGISFFYLLRPQNLDVILEFSLPVVGNILAVPISPSGVTPATMQRDLEKGMMVTKGRMVTSELPLEQVNLHSPGEPSVIT